MAVRLNPLEIEMLQQLAIGIALGKTSSRFANVSKRMLESGFVGRGPDGQLQPTNAGREWMMRHNQCVPA